MASDDAAGLLFPVGHCLGAFYEGPIPGAHVLRVRVGRHEKWLTDEQFAVWGLAHGTPDRPEGMSWNRAEVLAATRCAGIRDAESVLESLLEDGLLRETTPGTDSAVDFARSYRMVPLMLGLGNTAEEPGMYSVGLIGQPLVSMSRMAYDLFEWAHLEFSLWLACEAAAETAAGVGMVDPAVTDPLRMLDALLEMLHVLLGPNAVYLDTWTVH